jgi:RND family efflux transporter MFP subunit
MKFLLSSIHGLLASFSLLHAANFDPVQQKSYSIVGTLTPVHETKIGTQVSGRVKNILAQMGDRILKGETIVELDPVFLEIELKRQCALFDLAAACYEEANAEWQRLKPLWEKEPPSISKKSYEDAFVRCKQRKAQLDQAQADIENTSQRLRETKIVAPYDGIIVKRNVDFGDSVTTMPAVTVAEIIDDSQLLFEFSLPQDLLEKVDSSTAEVILEIPGLPETYKGAIARLSPQLEKDTRTFLCQVLIDNLEGKIHSGAFVKGTVCWPSNK